jgi:hypothetical protein
MPCRTDLTVDEIEAIKKANAEKALEPIKAKLDQVTRLLCGITTETEKLGEDQWHMLEKCMPQLYNVLISAELAAWWKTHKTEDEERRWIQKC